jgi:hypothetical protein
VQTRHNARARQDARIAGCLVRGPDAVRCWRGSKGRDQPVRVAFERCMDQAAAPLPLGALARIRGGQTKAHLRQGEVVVAVSHKVIKCRSRSKRA